MGKSKNRKSIQNKKVQTKDQSEIKQTIANHAKSLNGIITMDAFQNEMAKIGFGQENVSEGASYPLTRMGYNWNLFNSMYRGSWIVRKIIDVPPTDMLKNWITITSSLEPSKIKRIEKCIKSTKTKAKLLEGLKWGRLFGGAAALMLIDGHGDILETPLDYDDVMPGSYKGLLVFDRWSGIIPDGELITDINDADFGMPKYYTIQINNSQSYKVHHSRLLRFPGRDLPHWEKIAEQFWGESEVEIIFEELKKRDNTSYNIAYLVFLANIRVLKMNDLGQVLGMADSESQRDLYNTLQAQNTLMSNMGIYVMDREDDFDTKQYSFSGLDEIYQSFMLDVAGAAEMPVTKLFGREPAGFNSSGEGDLKQYYDSITEKQESYLAPILNRLMPIICLSEIGAIPEDFEWDFNPVMAISNQDLAELADKYMQNINVAFQAGLVDKATALRELKAQADLTGLWASITDEMIESAEGEVLSGEDQDDLESEISLEGPGSIQEEQKEGGDINPQNEQKETWRGRLLKAIEKKQKSSE